MVDVFEERLVGVGDDGAQYPWRATQQLKLLSKIFVSRSTVTLLRLD